MRVKKGRSWGFEVVESLAACFEGLVGWVELGGAEERGFGVEEGGCEL